MNDRRERSNQIIDRLKTGSSDESQSDDESSEQTEADNESKTSKTTKPEQTDKMDSENTDTSIKERESVLMYLPEDVRQDLDIRFDELNAKHKREHGEGLEKNRDYYPAVVEAGLTGKDLKDILNL